MNVYFRSFKTRKKLLLSSFVLVLGVVGSFATIISITDSNLLVTCIILVLVFAPIYFLFNIYREERIKKKENRYIQIAIEAKNNITQLNSKVLDFSNNKDYYKLLLLNRRLEAELKKIESISEGHWHLYARPMYDYFIYFFRSIMRGLNKGDHYITLSSVDFWINDKTDREIKKQYESENSSKRVNPYEYRSFLTTNKEYADRGVIIDRIIVIDREALNEVFSSSNEYHKKLKDVIVKFKGSEMNNNSLFNLHFYPVENYNSFITEKIDTKTGSTIPYALVKFEATPTRNNPKPSNNYMSIFTSIPTEFDENTTPSITVKIAEDEDDPEFNRHLKKFNDIKTKKYDKLLELDEVYDLLKKNKFFLE